MLDENKKNVDCEKSKVKCSLFGKKVERKEDQKVHWGPDKNLKKKSFIMWYMGGVSVTDGTVKMMILKSLHPTFKSLPFLFFRAFGKVYPASKISLWEKQYRSYSILICKHRKNCECCPGHYLNRYLYGHCSHFSQCLLVSSSVYWCLLVSTSVY